jgi:hypothetical protein
MILMMLMNECSSYYVIHQLSSTKDFVALCLLPMSFFISLDVFRPLDVPEDERVAICISNFSTGDLLQS